MEFPVVDGEVVDISTAQIGMDRIEYFAQADTHLLAFFTVYSELIAGCFGIEKGKCLCYFGSFVED